MAENQGVSPTIADPLASDGLTTAERDKRRESDRQTTETADKMNGLNIFAFFISMFMGKDSELLKNDDAINSITKAFSLDSSAFKNTIRDFQNGDISGFQAAARTRNSISDISNVDWARPEEAVSKYAETGNPLLELIADKESGGDYNRIYGAGHQTRPLTDMTINEVLAWQKSHVNSGSPSSAAGKYQIIYKTLSGLKDEMGLTGNEKYDEAMQDKMAMTLLNRRGYDDLIAGNISEQQFMKNASMEWAAAPKDMSGKSYYAGDGLNKAHIAPATMLLAIRSAKDFESEPAARTQLASNFETAKAAETPLDTDGKQPDPLTTSFDGNGVDEVERQAQLAQLDTPETKISNGMSAPAA